MGGVFITPLIFHVLFDAEERDVEAGDVDNVVKANFVSKVGAKFDRTNTLDGTGGSSVAKSDMRMRAFVCPKIAEQVTSVNHMAVSATVNYEFSNGPECGTMVKISSEDG